MEHLQLAFTAVLPAAHDPQVALTDMGVDHADAAGLHRFVGVPFSGPVTAAWDQPPLVAFRRQGRVGVLRSLARRPGVWVAMLAHGTATLDDLHLGYLANQPGPRGSRTVHLAR